MSDSESMEDYIHKMASGGFLSEKAEPLKCDKCLSVNVIDERGFDGHIHVHTIRKCGDCGKSLGEWDYGSWSW